MKIHCAFLSAFSLVAFTTSSPAAGFTYTNFKTFEYPGADYTQITGVSGGTIVGMHHDGYGESHGFSYDGSTIKDLDYPGSYDTECYGIDGNTIVGTWYGSGPDHGFIYDGAHFRSLDVPGANGTIVSGISGTNVVGWYGSNADLKTHGFIYNGSAFKTLDFPGARLTEPRAISGNSVIGRWYDNGWHDFFYDGSAFIPLQYPGTSNNVYYAVSGNTVIGGCSDAPVFIYDGTTFSKLALPDTAGVTGLSGNTVFGLYFGSSSTYRGFTAQLTEVALRVSAPTPNTIVISWPYPATGWSLQQNSDPSGTNWVTPPEASANDGTNSFITVNTSSGNRFFRLQQN